MARAARQTTRRSGKAAGGPGTPVGLWAATLRAGLGLVTLSAAAGLGRNTASMIAHGGRSGTAESWRKLQQALSVAGQPLSMEELRRPLSAAEVRWCRQQAERLQATHAAMQIIPLRHIRPDQLWRPETFGERNKESKTMILTSNVWSRLGLRDNPFREPTSSRDLYMTAEMESCAAMIQQAAREQGFLAVVGRIGSGKTTTLRAAIEPLLESPQYAICHVQALARERINARTVLEAMVKDLAGEGERIPASLEALTRKVRTHVQGLLQQRINPVLIIDEAQALHPTTFSFLKRIREVCSRGFTSGCAVILVGQSDATPDLRIKLGLPSVQEVARRISVYELPCLAGDLAGYVQHRFQRAGAGNRKVIDDAALAALGHHFREGGIAPQEVEQILVPAMVLAARIGESRITLDVLSKVMGRLVMPPAEGEEAANGGQ